MTLVKQRDYARHIAALDVVSDVPEYVRRFDDEVL